MVAYFDKWNKFRVHLMKHHRTKHKRYLNAHQKKTKQDESLGSKSGLIEDTPLCGPPGESLDVNVSVASKSTEDFTAHPERHPLIQNPCRS